MAVKLENYNGKLSLDGGTTTIGSTEVNLLDGLTGKTGADVNMVTGTAGTSGNLAEWNTDGDTVGSGLPTANVAIESFSFGASLSTTGNYALANGLSSATESASGATTKHIASTGGSSIDIGIYVDNDVSTNGATFGIDVNGTQQTTFSVSTTGTAGSSVSQGVTTSAGDVVEISYSSGDAPGNTLATFTIRN